MLAAAGLAFAGPTVAAADPPATYQTKCTDAVQLTPEINAKTCVTGRYANTGQTVFYSTVTVRNTSSSYSVTVDPDLLIDSTTVFGTPVTIPPRTEANAYGPSVENPPWGSYKTGRARVAALNWHTYQYSPAIRFQE